MSWPLPIVLASRSPRRLHMLQSTGWPVRVDPPDVDDGRLQRGSVAPEAWVEALALMKARALVRLMQSRGDGCEPCTILGADTVCLHAGEVLGQPDGARWLLISQHHLRAPGAARGCVEPGAR